MKKSIFIVGFLALIGFFVINAQSYKEELDSIFSKRFILKSDLPRIDSVLNVIKSETGINNPDFVKLAVIRINKSPMNQREEIYPLFDEFLSISDYSGADYAELKKSLTTISREYRDDYPKWFGAMSKLWNTEKQHASLADTLDTDILKTFIINLSSAKKYGTADSIINASRPLVEGLYGFESPIMEDLLKKRSNNLFSWLLFASEEEKANVFRMQSRNDEDILKLYKVLYGESSFTYQTTLAETANKLLEVKRYDIAGPEHDNAIGEAINLLKEWVDLKGDTADLSFYKNNSAYYNLYSNLASSDEGKQEAKPYIDKYLTLVAKNFGENSTEFFDALESAKLYSPAEEEDAYLDRMIPLAESLFGKNDDKYRILLVSKSTNQQIKGDLGGAIESRNELMENYIPGEVGILSDDMGYTLFSMADLNSRYGNAQNARAAYLQWLKENINNTSPLMQGLVFSNYMSCIMDCKKYNQTDEAIEIIKEILPWAETDIPLQINFLKSALGIFPNNDMLDFVNDYVENHTSINQNQNFPLLLNQLGETCLIIGNHDEGLLYIDKANDLSAFQYKDLKKTLYREFSALLQDDYNKAFEYNAQALEILENCPNKKNLMEYQSQIYWKAISALEIGRYDEFVSAVELLKSLPNDASQLENLLDFDSLWDAGTILLGFTLSGWSDTTRKPLSAEAAWQKGDKAVAYKEARDFLAESEASLNSGIPMYMARNELTPLQNLANEVRENNTKWSSRFDDPFLNGAAYNTMLLSKQLTLNTYNTLKDVIADAGSDNLKAKWTELTDIENKISERMNAGEAYEDLSARKISLQTQIGIDAALLGDIYQPLHYDWTELQKKLSPGDCAIEFSSFKDNAHEDVYVALVLTPESTPRSLTLFKGNDLSDKLANGVSKEYYEKIWQPVLTEFPDTKTIYFSPTGVLNLLSIENAEIEPGRTLSDKYQVYRVSSTKIIGDSGKESLNNAVVFGGIDYNNRASEKNLTNRYAYQESDGGLLRDIEDMLERKGLSYLPGTKEEAQAIESLLAKSAEVTVFYGEDATEDIFKGLSGKSPDIMHIATHGFYMTEDEAAKQNSSLFGIVGNSNISKIDRDMSRSGLFFAGVNASISGKNESGLEDGVLTAREVSALDLKGTDLVVLSACQTALGEVSGEGVFGLQRGLKMAGVNSILMTLWSVDDTATQILMTQFYQNLLSGMSKREALSKAKIYLRNYTIDSHGNAIKRYDNPKYWAAFVLLDSLD